MNFAKTFRGFFGRSKKHCSFCGKHHNAVAKLIAGDGAAICNECVLLCSDVLMEQCEQYRLSQLDRMRETGNGPSRKGT